MSTLRAALRLKSGSICSVRGLKSSLAIGQKAQIGPNSFVPRGWANVVVLVIEKMYVITRPELVELGAPKMKGQFLT